MRNWPPPSHLILGLVLSVMIVSCTVTTATPPTVTATVTKTVPAKTTCKAAVLEWYDIAQSFFKGMRAAMNVNYTAAVIAVAAVTPKRYAHAFRIYNSCRAS